MKKNISLIVLQAAAVLIVAALLAGCIDIICAADLYDVYAVLMAAGCLALIAGFGVMTFTESRRK